MMDKFTAQFQSALSEAQSIALGLENQFIEPVHILSALMSGQSSLLQLAGVNIPILKQSVADKLQTFPKVSGHGGDVQLSQNAGRVLNLMNQLAQKNGDAYIASELFYLAALQSNDSVKALLKAAGATEQAIEAAIE